MATHYTSLPDHIIYLILARLPVKSLLRFKTACRSWLTLISSRDFIKTHLSLSTNDPRYTYHHLLLRHKGSEITTCSVDSLLNEAFTKSMLDKSGGEAFKLDHPGDKKRIVIGCCNGLVCLQSKDLRVVFLWNPSTRKSRRLPEIDNGMFVEGECYKVCGLCYDESSDDFKVFAAVFGREELENEYKLAVFSSKSDSWRIIGDYPPGGIPCYAVFANGAVHFIELDFDIRNIVTVDIKTETCRQVILPKYGQVEGSLWSFHSFGENLIILGEHQETCSDYWVTKGVEECWRKLFTIPHDENIIKSMGIEIEPGLQAFPICMFVNGDVLLNLYSTIVLYSTKHNTFKDLLNFRFSPVVIVSTYVESLVSP